MQKLVVPEVDTQVKDLTSLTGLWRGFPGGTVAKNPPAKAEDVGLIPKLGRSPGEGNGNPLQYSCLGNPTNREVWWATVHGVARVRCNLVTKRTTMITLLTSRAAGSDSF